jgi:hypothetical protein
MSKKKTVGQASLELKEKHDVATRDPIELERAMHKDYEQEVITCVMRGRQALPHQNFYVVVEVKKERIMDNVIRNLYFYRMSCPTPTYDQTVYKYHHKEEVLEYLWTVPSIDTCQIMKDNILQVEEKELLEHVLDFADGTLLALAKQLNNEIEDSICIES